MRSTVPSTPDEPRPSVPPSPGADRFLSWILIPAAVVGVAGSLGLSLGLGLKACPLCFYQRSYALVVLAALVLARLSASSDGRAVGLRIGWVACAAGLGVALFHVYLEAAGTLECPAGLFAAGSAPQQSLAYFVVLAALLAPTVFGRGRSCGASWVASLLGVLLAVASLVANPPVAPAPAKPYGEPPVICRPPYRPA